MSEVATSSPPSSLRHHVWRRLRRNRSAMFGGILFIVFGILAAVGLALCASKFNAQVYDVRLAPSAQHIFGTDDLGRDILTRILYGAHLTLGCGVSIVILAALFGVPIGLAAGYFGGKFDEFL